MSLAENLDKSGENRELTMKTPPKIDTTLQSTRIIVKNIPRHYTPQKLKEKFNLLGTVTDANIIKKEGKTRLFAFVGFKTEKDARNAKKHYNNSYFDTSQVQIDFAYPRDSELIPRPWSKHAKGSSAYTLWRKEDIDLDKDTRYSKTWHKKGVENKKSEERVNEKKEKYKEFLELMGGGQSWNDVVVESGNKSMREEEGRGEFKLPTKRKEEIEGERRISENIRGKKLKAGMNDVKTHIKFDFMLPTQPQPIKEQRENIPNNSSVGIEHMEDEKPQDEGLTHIIPQKLLASTTKGRIGSTDNTETEENIDDHRLYITNIPYHITKEELQNKLKTYGEVEDIHIPLDKTGVARGFAYVRYTNVPDAINAFASLDQTVFMGRIIYVRPAYAQSHTNTLPNTEHRNKPKEHYIPSSMTPMTQKEDKKSSYKKTQDEQLHTHNYDSQVNWNYLFLNPNAVASAMANKLQIQKSELLSRESSNLATRMAISETQLIIEIKGWFEGIGGNIEVLEKPKLETNRSTNILILKNFQNNSTLPQFEELFERFGEVQIFLSPNNIVGIAQYTTDTSGNTAMQKLQGKYINGWPLYLEFAPAQLFPQGVHRHKNVKSKKSQNIIEGKVEEMEIKDKYEDQEGINKNELNHDKTIFIKNLNFKTTEKKLKKEFRKANAGKIVSVRIVKKKTKIQTQLKNQKHIKEEPNFTDSMGFGFIEYETSENAQKAMKFMQNLIIDEHSIKLSLSTKKISSKEQKLIELKQKRKIPETESNPFDDKLKSAKLLVKNLAFEASQKDLRELFSAFGQIKVVRLPKKYDGTRKGFAFIEFLTKEEAKNAFVSLQNTHLYGRKLVIQWAKTESKSIADLQLETRKKLKSMEASTYTGIHTQMKGEFEPKITKKVKRNK